MKAWREFLKPPILLNDNKVLTKGAYSAAIIRGYESGHENGSYHPPFLSGHLK
jgi:hypothetical protein